MQRIKVMAIVGTRPEAIKVAPILLELAKYSAQIDTCLVLTAQHRQMLDQVISLFNLSANYDLGIMQPRQSLSLLTSRLVAALDEVMAKEKPHLVLVQGDTTSTFVGGLVAFYQQIPVGHIEAGLRTYDKYQPFPEEINRRLTTALSDFHFAPTETAAQALRQEGIKAETIYITGNPVIDALLHIKNRQLSFTDETLKKIDFARQKVILLTTHRRENFGAALENICQAVLELLDQHPQAAVVCPVHLNPRVGDPLRERLGKHERIYLVPPLSYEEFVPLMERCYLVLTDSGGVQEEAPALGKPVLVLREVTERPEGVTAGTVRLVGTTTAKIVAATGELLTSEAAYKKMSAAINPYGDGQTAPRIVKLIRQHFQLE